MIGSNRFCHFGGWSGRREPAPRTEASPALDWRARGPTAADLDAWEELFIGYCAFYERPSSPEQRRQVWSWIEAGTIHCLLAVPADGEGRAVGLAHVRACPSPLRGEMTGYLDDLFVDPAARGTGVFEALMAAIRDLAAAEGWPAVRWITAADNARAQAAYERVSARTDWVTFQLDPSGGPNPARPVVGWRDPLETRKSSARYRRPARGREPPPDPDRG